MTGPVVVVGSPMDAHVDAVDKGLRDRGIDVMVVDTLSFPVTPRISMEERLDSITIDGRTIGRPAAVYVRDVYGHPLAFGVNAEEEMDLDWRRTLVAFREKAQMLVSLLSRWSEVGVAVYNPMEPDWRYSKAFQVALLEGAGLPVPRTVWTNDPDAVRRFARGRRVAYKPVAGGAATKELSAEDLTEDRLRTLQGAPVTFQELLEGDNYRVYCVDGDVVATFRVVSESLDYRQNEEAIEKVTLPREVLDQCLKATEILRLKWTGIDLRQDGEGILRFLELNPSPMFLGFDARAGTGILDALVNALAAHVS